MFRYLREQIGLLEQPKKPEGPEWPLVRAWEDGGAASLLKFYTWLDSRTSPSPDAAENTED